MKYTWCVYKFTRSIYYYLIDLWKNKTKQRITKLKFIKKVHREVKESSENSSLLNAKAHYTVHTLGTYNTTVYNNVVYIMQK